MIEIGIVGGTGYTGVELLRILALHPRVRVRTVTSRSDAGKTVASVYPNLRGFVEVRFVEPSLEALDGCEVVFFATPNGTAMRMAPALLAQGSRVIDLAADFRLRDPELWAEWYGEPHACPELLPEAIYGLPELQRSALRAARLVACPGCYPTAVQLGLLPLIEAGAVRLEQLIADVKSGISGAGRKAELSLLMSESGESFKAYNAGRHRHWPEIVQGLERVARQPVGLVFVPHLVPMIRGIHATLYAELNDPDLDLQRLYQQRYGDEPFVDVLPSGSHPDTRSVRGANACQIAVHRPYGRPSMVVVLSVIDNLVKGAAGQAVQCLNAIYGWEETLGLGIVGLYP